MFTRSLIVAGTLMAILGQAEKARASLIWVNTTVDVSSYDGLCSLREAVYVASQDACLETCGCGSGTDDIILATGQTYVINASLILSANSSFNRFIRIHGDSDNNPIIQGNGAAFLGLDLQSSNGVKLDLQLSDLTLAGFKQEALKVGSQIARLYSVDVRDNQAAAPRQNAALSVSGGGTLYVNDCDIFNNTGIRGGGIMMYENTGSLTVVASKIRNNTTSQHGGGIFVAGSFTCINSDITGNRVTDRRFSGGGVFRAYGAPAMNLGDCRVINNFAATAPNISF